VNADASAWEEFLALMGGPIVALWGTVLLALLAAAILLSLVQPRGQRIRDACAHRWHGSASLYP